jgi:hypothetical protein
MAEMIPFRYAGFWDVSRYILLRHREQTLLLESPFDDDLDEYPDAYSVYHVPGAISELVLGGNWALLDRAQLRFVGEVPINAVAFDSTKRRTLDPACLDGLFPVHE